MKTHIHSPLLPLILVRISCRVVSTVPQIPNRFFHISKVVTSSTFTMADQQSRENRAAWVTQEKGPIEVGPAPIVEPEKTQVLVRVQAAAMTPADASMIKAPMFKLNYPTIFSSNIAGFVSAIGPDVTKVKIGDRVVSGTNIWPSRGESKFGGMQRYTIVDEYEVLEIGDLDFGTALASSIQTACAAIFGPTMLNLDRPTNPLNPVKNGKKVLIWGGASAMGCLGISHATAAGYTVISTSSPQNFELLKERGADHVYDYNDEEATIEKIRALGAIDYYYDAVSQPASVRAIIKLLTPPGKEVTKAEVQTLMPLSMIEGFSESEIPEGVKLRLMMFRSQAEENKEFTQWMTGQGGYLEQGMKGGWIKGARPESIGGLGGVAVALERRSMAGLKGVSGARLIVEPWK